MPSSSLNLLAPPSSLPRNWIHHVFPSFHGADVRTNFLSHVVKEFRSKGIDLFIDNDIERSKSIGPELIEAVKGSRIAIVLLSENYASSIWCLNELVEIMKCREEQTVMSIFYQVDPTDIKKQTGDFGKVFRETCVGKTKDEIQRWKHALTEVAQIAGYHSTNWENEAEMIEDIASDVSNKLNLLAPCSDFDGLVGMESHMTELEPLLRLDSDEVRKIGIWGPPGIGKTTISRFLFNEYARDFQMSVFVDNIKRKYVVPSCSDDYSVKLDFQKKFMSQLTNETYVSISHLGVVKDRLKDKKVLLVLDDVDRSIQVEAMAKETSWFGSGSRIIVTAQDQTVLKASGIGHIYKVKLPSNDEALQIFCMFAFGQKYPKDGFKVLACEVMHLVGKLPLGLRVMGSHFRGMSKQDWRKALPRLRTHLDRDGEIASILKFSYDALNDEDKKLFLHIACFFYGEPVGIVEGCLAKCFLDVIQGIRVLAEKSLVYIEWGCIEMHVLLVQLGRKIVREQSFSDPGKRQFLNEPVDIDEVLSDDKSDGSCVIGIDLKEGKAITWTSERAFERLSKLQFLRIKGCGVNPQSMNYISRKLRVLVWLRSQMTCFPSSFNPKFLVQLEMEDSKLQKLWEETKLLNNLKWMNLRKSKSLEKLPDLSTATNLQALYLSNCSRLVELPSSIGNAIKLQTLDLINCSRLVRLPSSIGNAVSLQKMDFSRCSSLVELPSSIGNAINLQKLNLSGCSRLVELPSSIGKETNLQDLDLSGCSRLVKLPSSIGNATNLEKLDLNHCSSLMELPSSMRNLRKLSTLYLRRCSKLEVNLANVNLESLVTLDLSGCALLKSYSTDIQEPDPWIGRISRLRRLVTRGRKKLVSLPPVHDSIGEHLSDGSLLKSHHESYTEIQELDPWIGRVSRLLCLHLSGMKKLVSLPQLPYSVVELNAEGCDSLERLDCSFRNPNIRLNFANCSKLSQEAIDLIIQMPTRYAVFPCREVPRCFTYRSSLGSSLTVKLNEMPLGKSIKFKAGFICYRYDDEVFSYTREVRIDCEIKSGTNSIISHEEVDHPLPGHLHTFVVEVETEELISTELVFEFHIGYADYHGDMDCDVKARLYKTYEIKGCGILQLMEVPLLSSRDGDEDIEPSDNWSIDKP